MEKTIKIKKSGTIKGTIGWLSSLDLSIVIKNDDTDNAIIALLVDNATNKVVTILVEYSYVTGKSLHQQYISPDVTDACCDALTELSNLALQEIKDIDKNSKPLKFSIKKEG